MNTTQPSTVRRILLAGILLAGAVLMFVLATRDAQGTPVVHVRSAGVELPTPEALPVETTVMPNGAVIDAEPLVVSRSESPSSTTTAPARPTARAATPTPAPSSSAPAPTPTVAPTADGQEQVWYRNPDGYCGSTNRDNLQGRTEDPTCPDNKPGTYRDPSTEQKPYYVMGPDGYCAGMTQQDAAYRGYPDGDPRCEQGGYGSTPRPAGQ